MIAIFPQIAACAAKKDIELLAVMVRQYFAPRELYAPAPTIEDMMGYAGIKIETIGMADRGALLANDEKGRFKVVALVSDKIQRGSIEERFLLAHLFGHFLLHVQTQIATGEVGSVGFRESVCPLKRYTQGDVLQNHATSAELYDRECDDFAAALLLPRGMILRATQKLQDVNKIAEFFNVTKACLQRRLEQVGLRQEHEPAHFLAAEAKIGGCGKNRRASTMQQERSDFDLRSIEAEGAHMPRSFAAHTYGKQQRSLSEIEKLDHEDSATSSLVPSSAGHVMKAASHQAERAQAEPFVNLAPPSNPLSSNVKSKDSDGLKPELKKGMERLREIARQLDHRGK